MKEHLQSRHVNLDLYKNTLYFTDFPTPVATFSLFNLLGQMKGVLHYRPNASKTRKNDEYGRYHIYTAKEGDGHAMAVWGMESYNFRDDVLFLTEGLFDAVRLHNLGLPAVALLSNNPHHLRGFLQYTNRKLITVCDGDAAGDKLAKFGNENYRCPSGLDLGDMKEKEIKKMLNKYVKSS